MNPEWNDVPCPARYDPSEYEVYECELRINHEGDHRYTFTWESADERAPVYGPPIPHRIHVELGRCDLMCQTMQRYVERIASVTFEEKPLLWALTNA